MTLSEKIERIHNIPKLISELRCDRDRLLSVGAISYDKNDSSRGSQNNGTESSILSFVEYGNKIESLIQERTELVKEVQEEINSTITGEDKDSIDKREIVKQHLIGVCDGKLDDESKREKPFIRLTLKHIAAKVVFRDYSVVKRLYKQALEEIKYRPQSPSIPPETPCSNADNVLQYN